VLQLDVEFLWHSLILAQEGIMIHQYKNNGYNIVLDINSGSVHVVDEIVYDMIPEYEDKTVDEIVAHFKGTYSEDDLREAYAEITELKEAGVLFTEDIYEKAIDAFTDQKAKSNIVKAMCLHITHDCNLACKYCFAEEGKYHGERAIMSEEVGKKALDFLVANSGMRRNLEVDFFGGEPLLNWKTIKSLVEYGRELEKTHNKKFRFTLTTNGVLLNDEIIEYANKEMGNIVLSVDGRKAVHDRMRPFRNGSGSYDLIMPKFHKVADSRNQNNYYVRGTFTHYNLDFCDDVLSLADQGFKQISVEPVVAEDGMDYALKEEDLPKLFDEYDRLAKEMIKREKEGRGFNFFHFMVDLTGGPCVYKRLSGCGCGTEYLAVTPWGDFYPCHQFVGHEEFKMGDVFEGKLDQNIRTRFNYSNVYTKEKCKDCFCKFYCSGGCAANAYNFNSSIDEPYDIGCQLQRKRVECALMIKCALADEGIEAADYGSVDVHCS